MAHRYADLCRSAAAALEALPATTQPGVMVGFDGFIDHIIDVVATRESRAVYTSTATIAELGAKISAAAGKSANFELVTKQSKIGGNGPIMANSLCSHGCQVTAVGILGAPVIDPVFSALAERATKVISLGSPAVTDALEFGDGKLMLGKLFPLDAVSYPRLLAAVGGVAGLKQLLREPRAIATVNWTMTLELTAIWEHLAAEILPGLRADRPLWFIDLADPAKRTRGDLTEALAALQKLQQFADVVLGLNEAECRQICDLLGIAWPTADNEWEAAERACVLIREQLKISYVMCHLVRASAVAWQLPGSGPDLGGSASADGFWVAKPKITTGAGDHFNAGFLTGLMLGIAPAQCLQIGGATSGHYVRTAESPTRAQAAAFLREAAG
jgi:hypothetical protein